MNRIQELQLNILIKLDEVCRKRGLRYYLAYGTCIGAMRHKGFIPWDHDIDVLMPVEDARKLEELEQELGEGYYVSSYRSDAGNKTAKLMICDRNNKCRSVKGDKAQIMDVGIDIYPFYNCPDTRLGLLLNIWRSHAYKILIGGAPQNHGFMAKAIAYIVLAFNPAGSHDQHIRIIEDKLNYKGKSREIADYYGKDITLMTAITYKKEWFDKPSEMEFEGLSFYGPTDPDKYLTKRYGDYMTPVSQSEIDKESKIELISSDRSG